ncbi:MAG: NAD-dependent epimerase/dehydratase family protein, partial [Kiritimatiellia bacterium]|nr:NAD-dependent epimerase/dehydratase family protein [Kiritimatiellia bacterium]
MKILITGIGGFVGRHLVAECLASGHELFGYDRVTAGPDERPVPREIGDLCDGTTVRRAVAAFRPEACVHLAGMASVPACARNPEEAFRINVEGSLQFLRAFHAENLDTRFLFVSTSHVYGRGEGCLAETSPVKPDSLYALSKWCAEQAVLMTAREFGRPALVVRPVNHIGPGQARDYVVASFAAQLAEIARGESPPVLRVGNLDSKR